VIRLYVVRSHAAAVLVVRARATFCTAHALQFEPEAATMDTVAGTAEKVCGPLDKLCMPIERVLGKTPCGLRQEGRPLLLLVGAFLGGIQCVSPSQPTSILHPNVVASGPGDMRVRFCDLDFEDHDANKGTVTYGTTELTHDLLTGLFFTFGSLSVYNLNDRGQECNRGCSAAGPSAAVRPAVSLPKLVHRPG
jgi:hypothetical protein